MDPNEMPRDRREFLKKTGGMVLGAGLLPLAVTLPAVARAPGVVAVPRSRTLVCIFLRGGADGLNIVIPYTNANYYDVRPTISIPAETTEDDPGVIKLDERFGLHPALAPLQPFWTSGRLAPILAVGSPHGTRSHFDAQDFMEFAAPGERSIWQGWLNRFLTETRNPGKDSELRALAMQGLLPRSLRGEEPVLAVPRLRRDDSEGLLDLFDDVYRQGDGMIDPAMGGGVEPQRDAGGAGRDEAVKVGRSTIDILRYFWDVTESPAADEGRVAYPRDSFAQRLQMLARVIKADCGLEVAGLDLTSWDHHRNEGSTNGDIQRRLKILGGGLGAFATDLGQRLDDVTVLVMTEFGRNVAENGNRGTDHGRGGVMLALGGRVAGGRVLGDYGTLAPKQLADGRDLPVNIDFRVPFQEALEGCFDFTPPRGFFPHWTLPEAHRIGLMKKA